MAQLTAQAAFVGEKLVVIDPYRSVAASTVAASGAAGKPD